MAGAVVQDLPISLDAIDQQRFATSGVERRTLSMFSLRSSPTNLLTSMVIDTQTALNSCALLAVSGRFNLLVPINSQLTGFNILELRRVADRLFLLGLDLFQSRTELLVALLHFLQCSVHGRYLAF